jgi:eukaryotic-like serine/threonine-protein kinase
LSDLERVGRVPLPADPDVLELVRQERLQEAAELSSDRGDAKTASELFERACSFAKAAREALRAMDPERALPLAAVAGDEPLAREAEQRVLADCDRPAAARVARLLERHGHHLSAARVYEGLGETSAAARAFVHAGEPVHAATLLEAGGEPAFASGVLESAARLEPDRHELHVALGELLLRYGKTEAAVRALQKVPEQSPERRAALTYLAPALERLGYHDASDEAASKLAASGGPLETKTLQASEAEAKTRLFGRYEVVREVASTPSARVLLCEDTVRGERVAIKIFAAYQSRGAGRDALARFEREVRALGKLEHPNVVPLRDYLPEGPALVLAWMGGGTLEQRIAEGAIAPDRAVEIACSVLMALGDAHRLGILHRDIKPANVLFDDSGTARLSDFGVAHLGDASATATAGVFGTMAYMSPEQREGRPATLASDLFGVGVLLLEMLTGDKSTPMIGKPPRKLPSAARRNLDARHDAVVLRFIESDPARRPSDAFAARRELESLPWPKDLDPAPFEDTGVQGSSLPPSVRTGTFGQSGRVEACENGEALDTWLGRHIVRLPLGEGTLARASAFARASHPFLQGVLRVDRGAGLLWLEAPRGMPVTRPLGSAELEHVREAIAALHAVGVVHGQIDPEHVRLGDPDVGGEREVMVLFSEGVGPLATADLDRIALARLGRSTPPRGAS